MHLSHWLSFVGQQLSWGHGRPLNRRSSQRRQSSTPAMVERLERRQLLTTIDLAALTAAQGTTIFGADTGDLSGWSVSSAGDVNGDGFDDMLIGARNAAASGNAKSFAGDSYVVFGGAALNAVKSL